MLRKGIQYLLIVLVAFCSLAFKPEDKLLRKAIRELEKGNLKEAKAFYQRALNKNPENFKANLGLGLLYSELLSNYSAAKPYLEKAYAAPQKDTVPALLYALAKCYQHNGEFEKALVFFDYLNGYQDFEEEIDLQRDIDKRKADCHYALQHKEESISDWYIVNAGRSINTDMPEYVPVLTPQNELIFTSRRKDDEREQLSYLDGKYFESMYIASIGEDGFKNLRRYTLPDQFANSKFLKHHESVVSMSPDGQKLFTYHDNKIYEINMDVRSADKPRKLQKTVNFDYYQNHAFLTRDGKTLYFTSEAKEGFGGIDIYRATKIKEGEWTKPENLGANINTPFDEDAPFVTNDGKTLYFASTGHDGYGNFDIYRSDWENGQWSKPVNLGQPINSPGHDVFVVLDSNNTVGYFSSSRNGGFGDMDIYKINNLKNFKRDCPPRAIDYITMDITDTDTSDFKNTIVVTVPKNFKVLGYEWQVDETPVDNNAPALTYDYKNYGSYQVSSKVIAYCDTCLSPIVACNSLTNKFEVEKADTLLVGPSGEPTATVNLSGVRGELKADQLLAIGFNTNAILFDFAKNDIRPEGEKILNTNASILKKYPDLKIEVIGFTDARGPDFINKILSAQRAKNVKDYLKKAGVKSTQIRSASGKGASEFVNDCGKTRDCDEAEHQQNRRVILRVYR